MWEGTKIQTEAGSWGKESELVTNREKPSHVSVKGWDELFCLSGPSTCLSLFGFCCCDKTLNKTNFLGGKILSDWQFHGMVHFEGSAQELSRNLGAGTEAEAMEGAAHWLAQPAFLDNPGPQVQWWHHTHPPINNQENILTNVPTMSIWWEKMLNKGSFFQGSLVCTKIDKPYQDMLTYLLTC